MTPSTLALARRVRALLEAPGSWSQGNGYAHGADGRPVDCQGPDAVRWCIGGAIYRLGCEHFGQLTPDARQLWLALEAQIKPICLEAWNDDYATHADVLALLDRVIAEGER